MYRPGGVLHRVMCPLGSKCPRKEEAAHAEIYVHPGGATKENQYSNKTTRIVSTATGDEDKEIATELTTRISGVERAWDLEEMKDSDILRDTLLPKGRAVLLFVHGYQENFYRVKSHLSHLWKRLIDDKTSAIRRGEISYPWPLPRRADWCGGGCVPVLVGFTWPSSGFLSVGGASKRLARTLRVLAQLRNRVVLVGHSRGCEVVLKTLLLRRTDPSSSSEISFPHRAISRTVLVAAAVPSIEIESTFRRELLDTRRDILVLHSKADKMLRRASRFRGSRLLGLQGPETTTAKEAPPQNDGFSFVDCTKEVGTAHSFHTYIQRDKPFACIERAVAVAMGECASRCSRSAL